ncbi:MAG: hypothetical protein AB7E66_16795, partial [Parvibaculaceae bacterium]
TFIAFHPLRFFCGATLMRRIFPAARHSHCNSNEPYKAERAALMKTFANRSDNLGFVARHSVHGRAMW